MAVKLSYIGKLRSLHSPCIEHRSLHFVRAHFKEYRADAPLFGKHVGRYFWGMHAAGSGEQGRVVKDYKVTPR